MTKPIVEQAMTKFYMAKSPKSLLIADMGCSSGPNTLVVVSEIINVVEKICGKLGHESPEYQVFFNDLPGNDFNNIFRSLPSFHEKLNQRSCYFAGVPRSFYGRLFPTNTLHFVHSSYSLMWLSQVPVMVESNKGNIYMAKSSPESVLKAYYKQFEKDLSTFLVCRSKELVAGGPMVLTFLGRISHDPSSQECCFIWELLALVLNQMVFETNTRIKVTMWPSASGLWLSHCSFPILASMNHLLMIVADRMTKEKTNFINITVSLTKKRGIDPGF